MVIMLPWLPKESNSKVIMLPRVKKHGHHVAMAAKRVTRGP
jgi:hypothetical protein